MKARRKSEPFYKTTRLDGCDIWTGKYDYGAAAATGAVLRHSTSTAIDLSRRETHFSISREVGDAMGSGAVPYRLFRLEVIGPAVPRKAPETTWYAVLAVRVVEELEPRLALGPQNRELTEFLEDMDTFGKDDAVALANTYRSLGSPAAPDLLPEVRLGARRNAHFFLHDKVVRSISKAYGRADLIKDIDPAAMPLIPFMERLKRRQISQEELSRMVSLSKLPPGYNPRDAATAAQRVVTALLYRDLLSLQKISALVAPYRETFVEDDLNRWLSSAHGPGDVTT